MDSIDNPDGMEADEPKEYRWETGYEKTWEAIKEDDDGLLDGVIAEIQKAQRKRRTERAQKNQLGMMRHLFVIIDASESMSVPDLKPTRFLCTLKLMELFIKEFFDQNPISQMGLILLKNKRAEKLTELTGTPRMHLKAISMLSRCNLVGEPSLQNGLDLALKTLRVIPSHASREVLIVMGSLTTCDPIDINTTIDTLKAEHIRCSVISLSAEIHVCRHLAVQTNGTYGAVLDDAHFREQLTSFIDPPAAGSSQKQSLVKMGFPHAGAEDGKDPPQSMCMCHIDNTDEPSKLTTGGYYCPQCCSKYCELPVECQSCGLTLVSAPHLARSYHHLFPVANFTELDYNGQAAACYGCQKVFTAASDKQVYRCEVCMQIYCVDCDIFVHDTMHTCVGCNTIPGIATQLYQRRGLMPPPAMLPPQRPGYRV